MAPRGDTHRHRSSGIALVAFLLAATGGSATLAFGQSAFEAALRADVADALRTTDDPALIASRIGTGPYLLEALAPLFDDPSLGVAALHFVPRLRGPDPVRFEAALAVATRSDRGFLDAAAAAWLALVPKEGRAERLLALRAHAAPVLRRLGFVAAVTAGEGAGGALAESALASKDPWLEAFGVAELSASPEGRGRLLESLLAGRLPDGARAAAADLLADGPADVVVRLVDRAEADADFRGTLLAAPLSVRRRRDLLAEAFARDPAAVDLAALLLGLPPDTPPAACAATAFADPGLEVALADAARREVGGDEKRRALRAKLPLSGVVLGHAGDILALADAARVAHAPFLVASQDFVPWPERGRIAAALARLGHPEGRALLARTLSSTASEAVGGALEGFTLAKLRPAWEELAPLLVQQNDDLRSLGAQALARFQVALPAEAAVTALGWAYGTDAEGLLAALARSPDAGAGARVLIDRIATPSSLGDPDLVAAWLFSRPEGSAPEVVRARLAAPDAAVRARAVDAVLALPAAERARFQKDLEVAARDADPRVRAHAARAMGGIRSDLSRMSLIVLARDPSPLAREAALLALGGQEPFHVLPVLREAARDDDPFIRNAAGLSLLRHGALDAARLLLDDLATVGLDLRTARVLSQALGTEDTSREAFENALRERERGVR